MVHLKLNSIKYSTGVAIFIKSAATIIYITFLIVAFTTSGYMFQKIVGIPLITIFYIFYITLVNALSTYVTSIRIENDIIILRYNNKGLRFSVSELTINKNTIFTIKQDDIMLTFINNNIQGRVILKGITSLVSKICPMRGIISRSDLQILEKELRKYQVVIKNQ